MVKLSVTNVNESLFIVISNSVNYNFTLNDLKVGKTKKEDKENHGLGLLNIQHIADLYHGDISREISNEVFETTIVLYEAVKAL